MSALRLTQPGTHGSPDEGSGPVDGARAPLPWLREEVPDDAGGDLTGLGTDVDRRDADGPDHAMDWFRAEAERLGVTLTIYLRECGILSETAERAIRRHEVALGDWR